MTSFITKAAMAASVVALFAATVPASAQALYTNGPNGEQPNVLRNRNTNYMRYHRILARRPMMAKGSMMARRPLTVRRTETAAAAPAAAAGGVATNPITGVLGVGSSVVGLPFQVLGGVFPGVGTPLKGGVTTVRYEGARDQVAAIDEGWTAPIPVNRSGPVYVVENGDATVSPLALIGTPIRAVGTLAQAPFKVIGAPFGGTPTY